MGHENDPAVVVGIFQVPLLVEGNDEGIKELLGNLLLGEAVFSAVLESPVEQWYQFHKDFVALEDLSVDLVGAHGLVVGLRMGEVSELG